jgi:hypothetical protein
LKSGLINPRPQLKLIRERASVATVDGDNGLGLVIGPKCMQIALDKAKLHGSGWISVCNTNHYGAAIGTFISDGLFHARRSNNKRDEIFEFHFINAEKKYSISPILS